MVTRVSFVAHTSWCLRNLAKQRKDGENKTCPKWWDKLPSLTVNWLAGLLNHRTVCGYNLTKMAIVPAWDSRFGHVEIRQEINTKQFQGSNAFAAYSWYECVWKLWTSMGFPNHETFPIIEASPFWDIPILQGMPLKEVIFAGSVLEGILHHLGCIRPCT